MKLAVAQLRAAYGSGVVIRDLTLSLADGEALAVLGRNGMGKTTLLKAILGYVAHSGTVLLDDDDATSWPTARIVRRGIGYGPQEEAIFGELSVGENLAANVQRRWSPQRMSEILELFPGAGPTRTPARRHLVGRRAEDAGAGARAFGRTEAHHSR